MTGIDGLAIDMWGLARVLLYSMLVGVFLAVFFDVLRMSRVFLSLPSNPGHPKYYRILSRLPGFHDSAAVTGDVTKEPDGKISSTAITIVAFIEDILFFLAAAVTMAVFIFHANDGRARGILLLGAAAGFAAYLLTVGRLTTLLSELVVFLVRQLCALLYSRLLRPAAMVIGRAARHLWRLTAGRILHRLRKNAQHRRALRRTAFIETRLGGFGSGLHQQVEEACCNTYIKKENNNEIDSPVNSRQAGGLSGIRFHDHHPRQRPDSAERPQRGARPAPIPHRRNKREHRSPPEPS